MLRYNRLRLEDVSLYDKILFSPGPGLPKDYPILNAILSRYETSKSILGICLGQQAIAEFYGCRLSNLHYSLHGVASKVAHLNNCSLYHGLPTSFQIGHYHSWVVCDKEFSRNLLITSKNEHGLIMSLRHRKYDIVGVQFHPESILTEHGLQMIKNWLFH